LKQPLDVFLLILLQRIKEGFIFDKIRHDFANGRFVERIVYHDKISSFDGSETTVEK
jgi:hypothetical protein